MQKHWIWRVLSGLCLSLLLMLLTAAFTQPVTSEYVPLAQDLDCQSCHSEVYQVWQVGTHGESSINPIFREVGCQACHDPVTEDHFTEPMPVIRAPEDCGACHVESYASWHASKHGQVQLACVSCHDAHAPGLKAEDSSALCASCHGTLVLSYTHSDHYEEGLTCEDCHLAPLGEESASLMDKRDHSFAVDASTCGECHDATLHSGPAGLAELTTGDSVVSTGPIESDVVSAEPSPVKPSTYALISGLIGMTAGMILAPWLERWYARLRERSERS